MKSRDISNDDDWQTFRESRDFRINSMRGEGRHGQET